VAAATVEIVRRALELVLHDRDFDGAAELLDDHAEFDWSNSRAPYGGVYRGRDEVRAMWQLWMGAWEDWETEIVEAIEVDADTVVIATRVKGRGKGSGVEVGARGASVWTVRDGKIVKGKLFQSKAEALAAVGLAGQPPHGRPVEGGAREDS
jgi:ketosteroid isomerase-like protein